MKKYFSIFLSILITFFMINIVYAGAINVATDVDFVVSRDVSVDNTNIILDYSSQNYDLKTDIVLGDALTITPKVGITTSQADANILKTDIEVNSGVGFNLGADAELKVTKTKYVDFSLIGSYRFTRVDIDTIEIGVIDIDNPIETISCLQELEAGIKVSKNLKEAEVLSVPLVPYIGIVYSKLIGTIEANTSALVGADLEADLESEDDIGIRAGVSLEATDDITVSIDTKFVDQTAIGASIALKF